MGEFFELAEKGEKYAREIRVRKDTKYGGHKADELGIKGIYVDIFRKSGRLKSLVWDEYGEPTDEAILDNAADLANYALALAGVILKRMENKNV